MKLCELKPAPGTTKASKRKGRGHGTGNGKTAGRGHKGQNARAGGGVRPGFEGGQMPLYRKVPKRGFNNSRFAKVYTEISVSDLNVFENESVVTLDLLKEKGLIKNVNQRVVVLGNGELTKKIIVKVSRVTKSALQKIEDAGGKVEVV